MGRFGLRGNFPLNLVHLQRWSSWTVGLVRPKLPVPLPKIFVSSPTLLSSNQNFGRNASGSFRCGWKRCFNRTMSLHFLLMIPLIMSVLFGKWKALIACVAAAPRTHLLDHWYSSSRLRIAHVRYIKILTWLRGFLVIFLYLVWFSLRSSLFWKFLDNGVVKNLQFWPLNLGVMLEFWYIERGY